MKVDYDVQSDALYLRFADGKIEESEEVSPGVVLDFDAAGRIVGFEVLSASVKLAPGALPAAAE